MTKEKKDFLKLLRFLAIYEKVHGWFSEQQMQALLQVEDYFNDKVKKVPHKISGEVLAIYREYAAVQSASWDFLVALIEMERLQKIRVFARKYPGTIKFTPLQMISGSRAAFYGRKQLYDVEWTFKKELKNK